MKLSDTCIERPVLTFVLSATLVVFGVMGYQQLGVDQYPNMEFPTVMVLAILEGAAPEVMEEDVTEILEENINTVSGLRSLRSSTLQGATQIFVEFDLAVDLDRAAQDVRDKIAAARRDLPEDLEPPIIDKVNPSSQPIIWIPFQSDRPATEVTEYLKHTLKPYLEVIPGVGTVFPFGWRERAIRIWIDGEKLRARGLSTTDLIAAVRREHVELPGGLVESGEVNYSLRTDAEFRTLEELRELVIRYEDGAAIRLADVARVEDGAADRVFEARINGKPGAGIGLIKQPMANTVAISDAALERLADLRDSLPAGMDLPPGGVFDFSLAIRESVKETQFALVFGALLASLTVLVFLRRFRATLIVTLSIPLSLIATFGVMWLTGATLNVMTLLALTLAVGVVIDDAIVVLENIERHRERGEEPRVAAKRGTKEIAFAATAATLCIAAVFLPVVFVDGVVGSFLKEFGITVASAVLISLLVALTLTPMLAARIPAPSEGRHRWIYNVLERGFRNLEEGYRRVLNVSLRHRFVVVVLALLSLIAALGFGRNLSTEFFPPSDEGRFFAMLTTTPGTSLDGTLEVVTEVQDWFLAQPEIDAIVGGVGGAGSSAVPDSTSAMMVVALKPRAERDKSAQQLMSEARRAFGQIPGLTASVFDPTTMIGGSSMGAGDFEFNILANVELEELDEISDRFIRELEMRPGFVDLQKSLRLGVPEVRVIPDRGKAAALGVSSREIAEVVRASIGGVNIGKFKEGGKRYDIRMRLEAEDRSDPADVGKLFVRTRNGGVVELRNLTHTEYRAAPSAISRLDRQRSVTVSSNLENLAVGDAIETVRGLAEEILPEGARLSFSGSAEAFVESIRQFALAIGLAILVTYLLLAAQFESFVHPFTVMLSLPFAMTGALGALYFANMTLNLFSLIGVILLFGLVTKNSILLVDYANQLRERGMDKLEAMKTAAPVRMRPVLMTAISMIFGVLPAALGVGPGSESRAPMAVATAAGMFSSALLTLLVVPVFYLLLDDAADWVRKLFRRGKSIPVGQPTTAK